MSHRVGMVVRARARMVVRVRVRHSVQSFRLGLGLGIGLGLRLGSGSWRGCMRLGIVCQPHKTTDSALYIDLMALMECYR